MRKYLSLFLAVLFVFAASDSFGKSVSGTITMSFDLSDQDAGKVAELWIPYPVSNGNQFVSNINIDGDFAESAVYTDRKFQNNMLYAKWGKNADSRKLTFTFDVEREEVLQRNLPEKETAWDPRDYAKYLAPTKLIPLDGEVKKLADSITKGKTTVKEKAKAVYDWVCENTYRNPKTRGCGSGDVCALLKDPGGKCGDISSIFIALSRASGVPAREILGIRQGKKNGQDITTWQHCWAEFYLPGYGWVAVDPADVRKMMLKENLKLSDKKTQEYREYFWGGIDPYRVKLGEGRDLNLNPLQFGDTVNYLMYPFAQVGKLTVDWLDPEAFKYNIKYSR